MQVLASPHNSFQIEMSRLDGPGARSGSWMTPEVPLTPSDALQGSLDARNGHSGADSEWRSDSSKVAPNDFQRLTLKRTISGSSRKFSSAVCLILLAKKPRFARTPENISKYLSHPYYLKIRLRPRRPKIFLPGCLILFSTPLRFQNPGRGAFSQPPTSA